MGLGKWIALGAGFAAAPFTGGASIAAGTAVFNALNNKEAAKQAVGQQQTSTDQAMGLNQQLLGPYAQNGIKANNALAGLMGLGPLPGETASGSMMAAVPEAASAKEASPYNPNLVTGEGPSRLRPQVQMAPDGTSSPMTLASMGSQSGYGGGGEGAQAGSLVPVRGPNGQTYRIPPERLEEALANGGVQL